MITRIAQTGRALLNGASARAFRTDRAFQADTGGNIALVTAFTLSVLLLAIGAAFDFSRAMQRSNDIQNIVDSAVLAGASMRGKTEGEVEQQVLDIINGYNTEAWDLDIDVNVDGERIYVRVGNAPQSMFGSLTGRESVPIVVETGSPRAQDTPVHLALVLDTTDSMAEGGNLPAMQAAALELIGAAEDMPNGTRVSIVPFGNYVNIGTDWPGNPVWLDRGKDGDTEMKCGPSKITITPPVCTVTGTETYTIYHDGLNMGVGTRDTQDCTDGVYEDGPEVCNPVTYTWNGCMGSRTDGYAETADYQGHTFPAALNRNCGSELLPLGNNWNAMRDTVNTLTTSGSTYLPSGLSWGWRTLSPRRPYPQANNFNGPRLNRAMLFMTDGLNTKAIGGTDPSGNVTLHESGDGARGLLMTDTVCENIKQDGIELFVVAYRVPGQTDTVQSLANCATSAQHFFTPDNASELKESFMDVAQMLDSTRLVF